MIGHELAIEQFEPADAKASDEPRQRDLGRVGAGAEHRFAEKGAAEADAIEAADQFAIVPAFDRMSLAGSVETERGALDIGVDPRLGPVGAGADHVGESGVTGNGEGIAADPPGERARTAEAVERDDRAFTRLDPENLLGVAAVGHRENPGSITAKQNPWVESAHYADLQQFAHHVLRTAEADAVGGFDQRAVDQDRVLHHRVEDFVVAGVGEAEFGGEGLLGAEAVAGGEAGALLEADQFVA